MFLEDEFTKWHKASVGIKVKLKAQHWKCQSSIPSQLSANKQFFFFSNYERKTNVFRLWLNSQEFLELAPELCHLFSSPKGLEGLLSTYFRSSPEEEKKEKKGETESRNRRVRFWGIMYC